jgi:signal peptidase I
MNDSPLLRRLPPRVLHFLVGKRPKHTAIRASVLIVMSFVVFKFVLRPIRVEGISMAPTYREGSINFVNKLAYWRSEPQRGDVVAVRMAGESVMLLKRIVGLPGERVVLRGPRVFINGNELQEDYVHLPKRPFWTWREGRSPEYWSLGRDEYFFIGDNRSVLGEAHYKGAGTRDRIVGKVLF